MVGSIPSFLILATSSGFTTVQWISLFLGSSRGYFAWTSSMMSRYISMALSPLAWDEIR